VSFASDAKVSLRSLVRSPSYVIVAALTLGIGIGATTTIFSVVDGVLLRPMPYRDADRLVTLFEKAPNFSRMSVSYPDYLDWIKSQTTFDSIAVYRDASYNLVGSGAAERLSGGMISANMLATLGLEPTLGRTFTAEEDHENGPPAAMISQGMWQRRFNGSREVIGQTLNLSGVVYSIVGVLPHAFRLDPKIEVVTPIGRITGSMRARGNHPGIAGLGRLKAGVTIEQARTDLENVGRGLAEAYPDNNRNVLPTLESYRDFYSRDIRSMLYILMGAVVFVLLVAVANVANLALARGTSRRKEMAVRAALGANRFQLVRQVLVESSLVSILGGTFGVLLALWGVDVLSTLRPEALPAQAVIRVDLGILAFSLVVSVATGMLFGILPALQAARANVGEVLKDADERTSTGGRRQGRTRNALVVAEVALALVLLVGAGLSIRAFLTLSRLDPGFVPDNVLTMEISLPTSGYETPEKVTAYRERLYESLGALPGVASATLSSGLPLASYSETSYAVEGAPPPAPNENQPFTVYYPVDAHYAETMRLHLFSGRFIRDDDRPDTTPIVVIDEHLARTRFPGQDPMGKRLRIGGQMYEIIGVVGHVVNYGLGQTEAAQDQIYISWRQFPRDFFVAVNHFIQVTLRAHPGVDAAALIAPATATVSGIDSEQPVFEVKTMQKLLDESVEARRFAMLLLGVFATIALALAVIGLYSVMSYLVAQRRHEVGVRMALGARPGDVVRLVVFQGLRVTAIGLVVGTAASFLLAGLMSSILYGVKPSDPLTFIAVAAIVTAAATLATWLPARRAARVDPMTALRQE
jgi:putative ABC transport system permease protein